MTEELERLMRQARNYPNTATVDLLCAAMRKRLAEIETEKQDLAFLLSVR